MNALVARGLEFRYRPDEPVLRGVDLELQPGELLGIIGPNGGGKTTLLNLLAATIAPTAGSIELFGRPASAYTSRERARLAAMVPQETAVAFAFRVEEIVLMGRAPHLGRWRFEGRADLAAAREALELTGIADLAGRRFHELSGGERQRAMIAKALAQESRLLLLDEPTAFLDLRRQVEIYELIRGLAAERGLAVLAVSHDINLAALFCDRLAVLCGGRIEAAGPPEEVLQAERLSRVYGVRVELAAHPERPGAPLVFPLPGRRPRRDSPGGGA